MLPQHLIGPGTGSYYDEDSARFHKELVQAHPELDPDFLLDCCVHHPKRMNELFPLFDLERHKVRRISVTAGWIADSVRYDRNEALDSDSFYGFHVDQLIERGTSTGAWLVTRMVESGTWPNAPIIVSHAFAINELGAPSNLGTPYHLFEGCRRVSYLLAMLLHGLIKANSMHEVLELTLRQES